MKLKPDEKQIESYRYNFKKGKLGKGTCGTVYKGVDVRNNRAVAIKIIKKKDLCQAGQEEQLFNEIRILNLVKNPNIIEIIDVLKTEHNFYMILEFCDQGDLENLLLKQKSIVQEDHYHFLIDILKAFTTLIKQGVIHRDLKPANILISSLDDRRVYKLADFGLARCVDNFKHQQLESRVGTPFYMSPQVLGGQPYTSQCDIWSLGMLLFEIVYLKTPWHGKHEQELLNNIMHQHLRFPEYIHISHNCKDFIFNCLQIKEEKRFTWEALYKHPYVSNHFVQFQQIQRNFENKLKSVLSILRDRLNSEKYLEQIFIESTMNFKEFRNLVNQIEPNLNQQDIKYLFDEFDADGNGTIEFQEFKQILYPMKLRSSTLIRSLSRRNLELLKQLVKVIDKYQIDTKYLFEKYDTSKNNALDKEELKAFLKEVDIKNQLRECDVDEIINVFDENGDGEISYQEFIKVLQSIQDGSRKHRLIIEAEDSIQKLPSFECHVCLQQI